MTYFVWMPDSKYSARFELHRFPYVEIHDLIANVYQDSFKDNWTDEPQLFWDAKYHGYGIVSSSTFQRNSFDSLAEAKIWIESLAAIDGIFPLPKKLMNLL